MATLTVTASTFGGPGDPGTGSTGYRGDNLYEKPDSFAELSKNPGAQDFSALGNLPYMTPVVVTYQGKSKTLYKRDVGAGGSGIGGAPRAIDIWFQSAQELGISGLAVVQVDVGATVGGTAGLGGSGTTPNQASKGAPFTIGDTSNPGEDLMTGISRLAQSAYWYAFSDGETFYVADGTLLMQQHPARVISRFAPDVLHISFTWDNTAFQFASHHKHKARIQKKATLAKVVSPVEATVQLICPIDAVRGGDVVQVVGTGPGDGRWLVGDCKRSILDVYSELTLVPALAPIDAAAGVGSSKTSKSSGPGGTTATGAFTFPLPKNAASGVGSWSLDQGVDIAAPGHTPLFAVASGTVVGHGITGFGPSAPILQLDSPLSGQTHVYYGHAGPGNAVAIGTHVNGGNVISEVGDGIVGISTGPHLEIGFCDGNGTPTPGTASQMYSYLKGAFG